MCRSQEIVILYAKLFYEDQFKPTYNREENIADIFGDT